MCHVFHTDRWIENTKHVFEKKNKIWRTQYYMVFIINFKIKKLILTKPDQYTTCVLNKHMTKPCLHYRELWVLACYWCHNWHSNFGYNLRIPSWSIVNKLILIIFFKNSNWSAWPIFQLLNSKNESNIILHKYPKKCIWKHGC